ncbi:hypothetical protein [Couchioplanes azureus]|uniref:hypothetical protein n=1 Tax=Couchioplanes caeruleus TaxID=56438 RepID=UPI0016709E6A|nr:hypothetical protein [Couchioplanes caeruleus]GGQ76903.1 hypothetical protein GCM10010166_53540 [Couchioplanes caeruleus subsp. azureus]
MAEQDSANQAGHTAPPVPESDGNGTTTWRPALETDRVRSAAAGLGALRLARREPGPAGETLNGIALAIGSAAALYVINLILTPFGDAGWVTILRGLLIVLVAGVLIGLIRAVRGLLRARMAVYIYDHGLVGTARGAIRTIRWDQVTQIAIFATEGVHVGAENQPMIIPAAVYGGGSEDKAEFLNAVLPPLEQRGVDIRRF